MPAGRSAARVGQAGGGDVRAFLPYLSEFSQKYRTLSLDGEGRSADTGRLTCRRPPRPVRTVSGTVVDGTHAPATRASISTARILDSAIAPVNETPPCAPTPIGPAPPCAPTWRWPCARQPTTGARRGRVQSLQRCAARRLRALPDQSARLHWMGRPQRHRALVDAGGQVLAGRHRVEPTRDVHPRRGAIGSRARRWCHPTCHYAPRSRSRSDRAADPDLSQNAMRFMGRLAIDSIQRPGPRRRRGERIARVGKERDVAFLANHGVIVYGATVAHAYDDLYYLEARLPASGAGAATGRPLAPVPAAWPREGVARLRANASSPTCSSPR